MNDPRYETLLGWMRAKPFLAGIRCDGDDKRVVRIVGRGYSTAERAVLALNPSQIEGLDASGGVIRVWNMPPSAEKPAAPAPAAKPTAEQWPAGATGELGQVLAMACDRTAARYESLAKELGAAYKEAFGVIRDLYREQSERVAQLEDRYSNELTTRVAEAEQAALDAQAEADELRAEKEAAAASGADGLATQVLGHAIKGSLGIGDGAQPTNGAHK